MRMELTTCKLVVSEKCMLGVFSMLWRNQPGIERWGFSLYTKIASLAAALTLASTVAAQAAPVVSSLQANLPVQEACRITPATNFDFPAISAAEPISSDTTATATLGIDCNSLPSLTLSDGGTVFTLKNGGDTIPFTISILEAGGGAIVVGDSTAPPGITLVGPSGVSAPSTVTLTARLAPVSTTQLPVAGTYTDTITATLTYI